VELHFENLKVHQKALKFVNAVFTLSDQFPSRVQYSLGGQFRRAAISIVNDIAEGSNKRTVKEKTKFPFCARLGERTRSNDDDLP
jgi:four helix bundle protein